MWRTSRSPRSSSPAPMTSRCPPSSSPALASSGSLLTSSSSLSSVAGGLLRGAIRIIALIINYHLNYPSWSNGLLFHQAVVDLTRSAILIPLGKQQQQCHFPLSFLVYEERILTRFLLFIISYSYNNCKILNLSKTRMTPPGWYGRVMKT